MLTVSRKIHLKTNRAKYADFFLFLQVSQDIFSAGKAKSPRHDPQWCQTHEVSSLREGILRTKVAQTSFAGKARGTESC